MTALEAFVKGFTTVFAGKMIYYAVRDNKPQVPPIQTPIK
jgi:hypothetical protein